MHLIYLGALEKPTKLWANFSYKRLRNIYKTIMEDINKLTSCCIEYILPDIQRKNYTLNFMFIWKKIHYRCTYIRHA